MGAQGHGRRGGWQILTSLAREVLARQEKDEVTAKRRLPEPARVKLLKTTKWVLPAGDFASYTKFIRPTLLEGDNLQLDGGSYLVRAGRVASFRDGRRMLDNSLVATDGDFNGCNDTLGVSGAHLGCCVVFAGGDFVGNELVDTLVIASGEARLQAGVVNSVVIARGRMQVADPGPFRRATVLISGGKIEPLRRAGSQVLVRQNDPRPLGFVRFFETARVGVEASEPQAGGVRVTAVAPAGTFAAAGLRQGDLITQVDGQATASPEALRRALLRRVVEGGEAEVRLRRDGRALTCHVPLRLAD